MCGEKTVGSILRSTQHFQSGGVEDFICHFDDEIHRLRTEHHRDAQQDQDLAGDILVFALFDAPDVCYIDTAAVRKLRKRQS